MATPSPFSFWFLNRMANPVLRHLLRTPLGRRPGRRLAALRYHGRTSGRLHELVVIGEVKDGFVNVQSANATGWIKVVLVNKQ